MFSDEYNVLNTDWLIGFLLKVMFRYGNRRIRPDRPRSDFFSNSAHLCRKHLAIGNRGRLSDQV